MNLLDPFGIFSKRRHVMTQVDQKIASAAVRIDNDTEAYREMDKLLDELSETIREGAHHVRSGFRQ